MDREADKHLGSFTGEASRAAVLQALRDHVMRTVVLFVEGPDDSTLLRVWGYLVEGSRDPDTWESAERFAVIAHDADVQMWHLTPEFKKMLGTPDVSATALFQVPEAGLEEYLSEDPGSSGYRFDLGGGTKIAVVLWQDVLHLTKGGDLAPGIGPFRLAIEKPEDPD